MPMQQLLFSFQGRMRRSHWWAVRFGSVGVFFAAMMIVGLLASAFGSTDNGHAVGGLLVIAILAPLACAIGWVNLAASVKRLHDQDMSGWMVLLCVIPFFTLIVMGCLDGTYGSNRFGRSPKFPPREPGAYA